MAEPEVPIDEQLNRQQLARNQLDISPYQTMQAQANADAANLIQQINPDAQVEVFERVLRGEKYNYDTGLWEKKYKTFINDDCLSEIMPIVRAIVCLNTTISNLDDDEVRNIIIELNDELSILFRLKYKEFGIEKANLSTICNMICRMAYMALKRGYMKGDKELIKGTTIRHEQIHVGMPQRKDSVWSAFPNPFNLKRS